jgi:AcrR family transcriptional regulator
MLPEKTERIIEAAAKVFLRYGYKKVTMGDLAEAVPMSRPALYLVFDSKEAVFRAVLRSYFDATMAELQAGLPLAESVERQMLYAFEVWCVRPFEMTIATPDTKDLLESGYEFAHDVVTAGFDGFEALLAQLLEPVVQHQAAPEMLAQQVARILVSGITGLKQSAGTAGDLRQMIGTLLTLVLAGLGSKIRLTDMLLSAIPQSSAPSAKGK